MLKVVILLVAFVSLCDTLCKDEWLVGECSSVHDIRKLNQQPNWIVIFIQSEQKQRINRFTFVKTPYLIGISFWNAVEDIEEFTFQNLNYLLTLNFEYCDLQNIKKTWFSDVVIKYLKIENSNVQSLEPGCFEGCTNLTHVRIEGNNISTIVGNVFSGTSIVELYLRSNQIQFIQDNAFINMSRLKYLWLSNNLLKSFIPKVILPNLQQLFLYSNQIEMIPSGSFNGLRNLEILDVSCNKLKSFPESAFPITGLPSLTQLRLGNNRLNYMPRILIPYFPKLKIIDIFGNPWQCACYQDIMNSILLHNVGIFRVEEYLNGQGPVCVVPQTGSDMCLENVQFTNDLYDYFIKQIPPYPIIHYYV